eukprot:12557402-Alexandrium_andersonii.AAC.1
MTVNANASTTSWVFMGFRSRFKGVHGSFTGRARTNREGLSARGSWVFQARAHMLKTSVASSHVRT